ncbi:hypothetical protein HYW60_03020, partial [Candidatus Kaiserbacteria bacterium]|nr:hypothetical protein [Candidatus Kaiserbacteria bacterium]
MNGTCLISNSQLLSSANTWSALQTFSSGLLSQASSTFTGFTQLANASTTQLTNSGNTYLTSLASAVLGVDTSGKVVATTSIGANLLSGTITNAQLANSSVTVNSAGLLTGGGSVSLGGTLTLNASTSPTVGYVFATSTIASTLPYASSTALTVSGTGYFGTASSTNITISGTPSSILSSNSSGVIGALTVGNGLSFSGNALSTTFSTTTANTWTSLQQFSAGASTTQLSCYGPCYFGGTATSSFSATGLLTLASGGSASAPIITFSGDTNTGIFSAGADTLNFSTAGSERMRIDSSGNVGIGTTSPYAKLSVHALNGQTNTTLFAIASSTASATTTLFSVDNTGLTTIGDSSATGDANFQFAADENAWSVGYNSSDKTFRISSSTILSSNTVLTITKGSTNNVGIGTTTPNWTLTSSNATGPQLSLGDGANNSWTFRNSGATLYLATSTYSATSTVAALSITGGCFSVNGTCLISNSQLLSSANTWSALQTFSSGLISQASSTFTGFTRLANASTTQLTNSGNTYLTSLASALLGTDSTGKVVATTSIGANFITGVLPIANGGTNASSQTGNGVTYFDGTRITSGSTFTFDGTGVGIGTSTPTSILTLASSTKAQLALTDASSGNKAWTLRSINNNFYLATSTYSATSTVAALSINGANSAFTFNTGATSTFSAGLQSPYLNV